MSFLSMFCRNLRGAEWVKRYSKIFILIGGSLLCALLSVQAAPDDPLHLRYQRVGAAARPFIPLVQEYLRRGDSSYAQKDGYESFQYSLHFFDTAHAIAQQLKDTALLAETTAAIARVYDAWNEDPQKTINLLRQSIVFMESKSNDAIRRYYTRYLLAHAYQKAKQEQAALYRLENLLAVLSTSDTALLHQMPFTVEMAFTAVKAGNIELADRILNKLTRREWIANDTLTHNYLDDYYLTRAYIDVADGKAETPYVDSFKHAFKTESVLYQKKMYAQMLAEFFKFKGNFTLAFYYMEQMEALGLLMHTGQERDQLSKSLAYTESGAQKRQLKLEQHIRTARITGLWVLGVGLMIITVLSFYLYNRNYKFRQQSKLLHQTNQALDEKVAQVELLNQEIEHRIKNNLYAVQSLLKLQSRQAPGEEIAASLQMAQLRVSSIALLHTMLLKGRGAMQFGAYAQLLFENIIACYEEERKVNFHLKVEDCPLPETTYSPLSLILNEWITNSVKYARPLGRELNLFLSLTSVPEQGIVITYYDNGLPPYIVSTPASGLGSKIINMLTRQMGAPLIQESLFHYKITLPYERENQSTAS